MGVPIRINEIIYQAARKTARAECRSIPNQIEYWAKIGKCALDNPDLPIELNQRSVNHKKPGSNLSRAF